MINYEYKAKIIASGLCKNVKKLDRQISLSIYKDFSKAQDIPFEEAMFCSENHCSFEDLEEARKINNANYRRVKRLKDRIEHYLLQGECIFLTLTFSPDTLAKTSKETRRRYVARYLKTQSNLYIANIDYGDTTEREHYHAVVVSHKVDMKSWVYGFAYVERIKKLDKASTKLAKYVCKLTNHAIKETTQGCYCVYSR